MRGTYDVLRYTIEEINRNKASLFEANRKADAGNHRARKNLRRESAISAAPGSDRQIRRRSRSKASNTRLEDSDISGTKRIVYGTKPLEYHDSEI